MLEPSYRLHEAMDSQIGRAAAEADAILLLLDATRLDDRRDLVTAFVERAQSPIVVALNKTDLLTEEQTMAALERIHGELGLYAIVPISALRVDNLDNLLNVLESFLPLGPQLYPEDMIAEQPERFFVAELIREAAFEKLSDELPYTVQVVIEEFDEPEETTDDATGKRARKTYIDATLYVERDTQKRIVIGKKGARLRDIGRQARERIEALIEAQVYLDLHVKVRRDWRNRDRDLKEFGYR